MDSRDQEQSQNDTQEGPRGRLTFGDRTWVVESEPKVVDTDEDYRLVEVWVKEEGGGVG